MTVRELLDRIDSRELSEWMAYDRVDPIPDPWLIGGVQAATFANAMGGKKKRFVPADFVPRRRGPTRPQSARQIWTIMGMWVAATKNRESAD